MEKRAKNEVASGWSADCLSSDSRSTGACNASGIAVSGFITACLLFRTSQFDSETSMNLPSDPIVFTCVNLQRDGPVLLRKELDFLRACADRGDRLAGGSPDSVRTGN